MNEFLDLLRLWGMNEKSVDAIILVGSCARGTNTEESDIDLCIITTKKEAMVTNPEFARKFGEYSNIQTEYYGACTSLRVFYKNGLEVEFGIVEPSWISIPLDAGTKVVLMDGYKVLVDKKKYFEELVLN